MQGWTTAASVSVASVLSGQKGRLFNPHFTIGGSYRRAPAAASPRFNENRNLVPWERRRLAGNSLPKIGVSIKAILGK
jgi:hypothetical protein